MNKPQYAIGVHKKLTGDFAWTLVPVGVNWLALGGIQSVNFYNTRELALKAAKKFVEVNALELYQLQTSDRKFSRNDSVVVVDKKCITCDKKGWVECYDGPDNSKVKVGFDHGWAGWYDENQLELVR